jgi:carotenoid 1,2-hydratase
MPRPDLPPTGAMRAERLDATENHACHDATGFRLGLSGNGRSTLRPGLARLDGVIPPTGRAQPDSESLSCGGERASGTGRADGGDLGATGSTGPDAGYRFNQPVPHNGYAWWYVDGLSDDGRYGLTVIAFIGSVFSPYYARARRRGSADPADYCAVNAVLYGPRIKRWAMTERDRSALWRSESHLCIGRSTVTYGDTELSLAIDETCVPLPFRLRGTIRLRPELLARQDYPIDPQGRHVWRPVMPSARIEVEMQDPELSWTGHGYADHNRGAAPLEQDFSRWTWARFPLREGNAILYDTIPRHGNPVSLALRHTREGVERFEAPPPVALSQTGWRVARELRSDAADEITVRTLEDTPFYARSVVTGRLLGERATGMHESLSLDRFASRWVQAMLPFRMPRRK